MASLITLVIITKTASEEMLIHQHLVAKAQFICVGIGTSRLPWCWVWDHLEAGEMFEFPVCLELKSN
jgi:hypothetical protein